MFDLTNLFVTPHAIAQFQQRIAPLGDERTRSLILDGIRQATNIRMLPDGRSWRVRTQRPFPFEFRAFCVFDETRGHMVVTTVVRGDSRATRDRRGKSDGPMPHSTSTDPED